MTDHTFKQLERLSQRARVLFAAVCARRVGVIYAVTCEEARVPSGPRIAVETALNWARSTAPEFDQGVLAAAREAVNAAFPPAEMGGGADHFACAAAAYELDSITDSSPRAAWIAAGRALDAIGEIDEAGGEEEEQQWQSKVLNHIALADARNDLASLGEHFTHLAAWEKRLVSQSGDSPTSRSR